MGIMDYLNPWKALREARRATEGDLSLIEQQTALIRRRDAELVEMRRTITSQALRIDMQKQEIIRLNEEHLRCVRRDPKTGRYISQPKMPLLEWSTPKMTKTRKTEDRPKVTLFDRAET